MKKPPPSETDIVDQPYRGPSVLAASIGESALQGKLLFISGILAGVVAGAVFPKKVGKIIEECRTLVDHFQQSENLIVSGIGGVTRWSLSIGEDVVGYVKKFGAIKTRMEKIEGTDTGRRIATAINGGIFLSAATSLLGFFTGGGSGAMSAIHGRKQFNDAKTEIVRLRLQLGEQQPAEISPTIAKEAAPLPDKAAPKETPVHDEKHTLHLAQPKTNWVEGVATSQAADIART